MQKFDRFHPDTNQLALSTALFLDDREEWVRQFKILNKLLLRDSGLVGRHLASQSEIQFSEISGACALRVKKVGTNYRFIYKKSFVEEFFYQFRHLRTSSQNQALLFQEERQKKIHHLYQFVFRKIGQCPFFGVRLKTKGGGISAKEIQKRKNLLLQYIALENHLPNAMSSKAHKKGLLQRKKRLKEELKQYVDWNVAWRRLNFVRLLSRKMAFSGSEQIRIR